MIYRVQAEIVEAKGMAVAKYLGSHGTAEIEVTDRDGRFSSGKPDGLIEVSVKSFNVKDCDDHENGELDLASVLNRKEVLELQGWGYATKLREKMALVDVMVTFGIPDADTAPKNCSAKITATGRGPASPAFKNIVVTGSGTLQSEVVTKGVK